MSRHLILLVALLVLIPTLLTGCPEKEPPPASTPLPEVTLSPKPVTDLEPQPTPTTEPTGTVAAVPAPKPEATPEATLSPTPTPLPAASSTPLTILSIIGGDVYVLKAGTESWEKAEVGTTLQPGDIVKSARGSHAEVTFFDGSTIELEQSTELAMSELSVDDNGSTTTRLAQSLGKTISRVKKLADPASKYEVETPAAIAAVRGSVMEVTVEDDGTTTVANVSGDIRVIVDGEEYIIHEGMKRTIKPGEKPGPEVPINPTGGGGGGGGGHVASPQGRMEVTIYTQPPIAHVGDIITYTYYVRNTGDLPLNNISVSNDITGNAIYQSGDVNINTVLDRNEIWVFTSTYMVRAGDPSLLIATTTVSALTFTSVTVIDTEIVTTSIEPDESDTGIVITKIADPLAVHEDDDITYTYYVLNTGNMSLMNVLVTDDRLGSIPFASGDDNENSLLDIDEIWVFTAIHAASGEDPDLLVNIAEASGMDALEQTIADSDTANVSIIRPGIALVKTADPLEVPEGDDITYTYTVTNTGNTPLAGVSVTDDRLGSIPFTSGDDNENSLLDTDETWVFTAIYTTTINEPDFLINTAEVSGSDALERIVTDSDTASVSIIRPGIALVKTADPLEVHEGDNITYTYTVTTTSDISLSNISVTDDRLGSIPFASGDDNENGVLDGDETWLFTANYTTNVYDPDLLVNIAEASGSDALERIVTDSDTASVSIIRPGIALVKTADPLEVHEGDNITYTYTVTTTSDISLSNISVTDDRLGSIPFASGDDNENGVLDGDETWLFTANYTTNVYDPDLLVNIAEASGMDVLEQTFTDSDTASVSILRPGIALVKDADPLKAHEGDNITYTYTLTNTGNTPLSNISVTDDLADNITFVSGDDNENDLLDGDEAWVFTANYTVSGDDSSPLVNTAEASGMDALEQILTDSAAASVSILRPGIALVKTADPSDDVPVGDNVTYTYTVTNTGNTPLSGITVTDDRLGPIPYTGGDSDEDGLLDIEETWVFTAVYTVSPDDECPLENIAVASGQDELLRIVTAEDTATVYLDK